MAAPPTTPDARPTPVQLVARMKLVAREARAQADTALVAMETAAAAALEAWATCTKEMESLEFGTPLPKDADLSAPEEACKVLTALETALGVLQDKASSTGTASDEDLVVAAACAAHVTTLEQQKEKLTARIDGAVAQVGEAERMEKLLTEPAGADETVG